MRHPSCTTWSEMKASKYFCFLNWILYQDSWTHLGFTYVYHTLPFSATESVTRHCLFSVESPHKCQNSATASWCVSKRALHLYHGWSDAGVPISKRLLWLCLSPLLNINTTIVSSFRLFTDSLTEKHKIFPAKYVILKEVGQQCSSIDLAVKRLFWSQ